jgi:hypothetical protein
MKSWKETAGRRTSVDAGQRGKRLAFSSACVPWLAFSRIKLLSLPDQPIAVGRVLADFGLVAGQI